MKTNLVVGFDVSKLNLDFAQMADSLKLEGRIDNNVKIIKKHLSQYDRSTVQIVFEPTGTYSDKLEQVLIEMGFTYHKVNPVQSHHFMLSNGVLNKTDRQAAVTLAQMGKVLDLPVHQPASQANKRRKHLIKAIVDYEKQQIRYKNKLHALAQLAQPIVEIELQYKDMIEYLADKIAVLQKELVDIKDPKFETNRQIGMSVCGIGETNAIWILTLTNNLENFDMAKQVIKFLGLAPGSHQSGSSVNKKSGINKSCTGKIRGYLFMGAKSAIRYNPACKELYERLRARGKNYYQAMVAVMAKLVKQFFAVVKSGKKYEKEYHLKFQKM